MRAVSFREGIYIYNHRIHGTNGIFTYMKTKKTTKCREIYHTWILWDIYDVLISILIYIMCCPAQVRHLYCSLGGDSFAERTGLGMYLSLAPMWLYRVMLKLIPFTAIHQGIFVNGHFVTNCVYPHGINGIYSPGPDLYKESVNFI